MSGRTASPHVWLRGCQPFHRHGWHFLAKHVKSPSGLRKPFSSLRGAGKVGSFFNKKSIFFPGTPLEDFTVSQWTVDQKARTSIFKPVQLTLIYMSMKSWGHITSMCFIKWCCVVLKNIESHLHYARWYYTQRAKVLVCSAVWAPRMSQFGM